MDDSDRRHGEGAAGRESEEPAVRPIRGWRGNDRGVSVPRALLVALVLVFAGGGIWLWLRSSGEPEASPPEPDTAVSTTPVPEEPESRSPDLPALAASDSLVRRLAEELSERPRWASWLATDGLVRRFVAAVVSVSVGSSPAEHLGFLAPDEDFAVRETEGSTVVAPASYRRYDLVATTFASLDTEGTARLYDRLHPLFEEAHAELGVGEGSFDAAFARAVGRLLAVQVPEGPVELGADGGVWVFCEPELEALSPAAKHLLRMGPENARRTQGKLRELADAIGIEPRAPDSV